MRRAMITALMIATTGAAQAQDVRFVKNYSVSLCAGPTNDPRACPQLPVGTRVEIGTVHQNFIGQKFYLAKTADGQTGYIREFDFDYNLDANDPIRRAKAAKADCERRGEPKIGMTEREAVATCWGRPRYARSLTSAGSLVRIFSYGLGQRLYFHNGHLTLIEQ